MKEENPIRGDFNTEACRITCQLDATANEESLCYEQPGVEHHVALPTTERSGIWQVHFEPEIEAY